MARLAKPIKRLLDSPEAERRLGPFVLVDQLGRGGFAPVWLAREVYGVTELRTAAVKLFSLEPEATEEAPDSGVMLKRRRIIEEARALCQVEHPNVVRFYALPIDEAGGVMGLAMEHVAGTALDKRLAARGRLTIADTLAVGIAMASALSAVHRAGLVHRDVKPANVVEAGGVFKLIDFGIAAADALGVRPPDVEMAPSVPAEQVADNIETRIVVVEGGATSPIGIRCGTLGYIDPVCVSFGVPATPASDLYALGAMLFECITGQVPAAVGVGKGKGLRSEVLDGREPAPPVRDAAPGLPASLAELVDALLAPVRKTRPLSAEWVAIRLEQVKHELAGLKRALPPESIGPYRGLGRFEERDRDVYFGRTSETAAALETLRSRGVVALVGPSGSGKSSLARAGVLPAVAEGGLGGWPKRWDTAITEPGEDPRAAIAAALDKFIPSAAELSPDALVMAMAERAQNTGWGLVLLIDQLEELATVSESSSQAWTVAFLARLGQHPLPGVRAVLAARRDLLDQLLALGELAKAIVRGSVLIEPITDVTWGDVVEQALAAYGYTFEDDALRDQLLAELKGTASAMPLVQFALTQLWYKRDTSNKKITRAGLLAIGGIPGALERHAEATLLELAAERPGAEEAARSVLLALTTPRGTRATRSVAALTVAAGPLASEVVDAFENGRLIVRAPEGVTLAHEALLVQWGKLKAWVAEEREDRLLAEELERDAERWREDPDGVPLWQRRRLAFGEDLSRRGSLKVSEAAVAFLRASRRAERRVRWLVAGSAAVALLSISGAGLAYVQSVRAQEATTRQALVEEQRARGEEQRAREKEQDALRVAEARTREVEVAQARIVQLEKERDEENSPERKRELQDKIDRARRVIQPPSAPTASATTVVVSKPPEPPPPPSPTTGPTAKPAPTTPPVVTAW